MSDSIMAKLGLDISGFTQGVDKAKASVNKFATGELGSIKSDLEAAFTVGAITSFAASIFETASRLDDLSKQTGIGTDDLQKLDVAAKQNGSSIDSVAHAFVKLSSAISAGLASDGEQRKAFADLGISLDDLKSKNPHDIFLKIADAVKKSSDPTATMANALKTMGKGSGELVPLLMEGADGIRSIGDAAMDAGSIMDATVIRQLDALGDRMEIFKGKSKAIFAPFVSEISQGALVLASIPELLGRISAGEGFDKASRKTFNSIVFAPGEKKNPIVDQERIADEKTAEAKREADRKRTASLTETLDEKRRTAMLERLNLTDRLAELQKEEAARSDVFISNEADRVKNYIKILDIEKEIRGVEKDIAEENLKKVNVFGKQVSENIDIAQQIKEAKSGKGFSASAIISDSLARIGGFVGGANDNQSRQLEYLSAMKDKLVEINKNIEKINNDRGFGDEIPDATAQ